MARTQVSAVYINFTSLKKHKNYGKFPQSSKAVIQRESLIGVQIPLVPASVHLKKMHLKPKGKVEIKRDFSLCNEHSKALCML